MDRKVINTRELRIDIYRQKIIEGEDPIVKKREVEVTRTIDNSAKLTVVTNQI
jgi:hypothetical protein